MAKSAMRVLSMTALAILFLFVILSVFVLRVVLAIFLLLVLVDRLVGCGSGHCCSRLRGTGSEDEWSEEYRDDSDFA